MAKSLSLYFHIPFCQQKCAYCSFFVLTGREALQQAYWQNLEKEILLQTKKLQGRKVSSLYFGGGTASLMPVTVLEKILQTLKEQTPFQKNCEVTLEANPESLTLEKLRHYRKLGITRLSLGLQAWQDTLLQKMGRQYNHQEFIQVFTWARQAGFRNINIDLIFGYPGQSLLDWQESLTAVLALQPEHLSCYSLEIDNASVLAQQIRQHKVAPTKAEVDRQMATFTRQILEKAGYQHYEISNYAKKGKFCRHNWRFWQGKEYLGFGTAAHSFFADQSWQNTSNLLEYQQLLAAGKSVAKEKNTLRYRQKSLQKFALSLRCATGADARPLLRLFPKQASSFQSRLNQLCQIALLQIKNDRYVLTDTGENLINRITAECLQDFAAWL